MMNYQQLLDLNKKRAIKQLAFITTDVDKAVKQWVELLNVGPWTIYTFCNETMEDYTVNGKLVEEPFEFIVALTNIGDLNIEVLQPVKGPNIYVDHLNTKGEGLHHFKEYISLDDFPSYMAELQDKGLEPIQSGWCGPDLHTYINTMPVMGFNYELGNCPPDIDIPEKYIRYYPEKD